MTNINDGGVAFPTGEKEASGLTVRDYFAAAALTGLLAGFQGPTVPWAADPEQSPVARKSYEIADAMLKTRAS